MTRRIQPLCLLLMPALALVACDAAPGDPLVAPDSPVFGVEARSADGVLFAEVGGPLRWPLDTAVRIHIDAFDAQDRLIEEHWGLLSRRADDGEQAQVLWWPTMQRAAVLGVRILVDDRVVFSHRLDAIGEVADAADGPCDTLGARDRCGLGRICWPMTQHIGSIGRFGGAERYAGRCVAGDARGFQSDARFAAEGQFGAVDLRFPDAPEGGGPISGSAVYPEREASPRRFEALEPAMGPGWRATMRLIGGFRGGALPDGVDVYVGPHRFACGLSLEAPPVRRLGEVCDAARTVDVCAPDTLCDGGRCVRAAPPMLADVRARGHAGGLTLWFEARDPQDDIVRYDVRSHIDGGAIFSIDAWGAIRNWYPLDAQDFGWTIADGAIESDGGVHRARLTFGSERHFLEPGGGLRDVTLTATDVWGGSDTVTVEVEPAAPEPVEAGAACDPLAVEFACPEAHVCDVADGAEAFACHGLNAPCPAPTAALGEQGIEARWGDGPAPERVFSCSGYIGQPGTPRETHSYTFTAARAGEYRFIAEPRGSVSALSVRHRCDLPRTETSCGNTRYPVGSARLEPGETVHVAVQRPIEALLRESWWVLDDPDAYALRVELRD